MTRVLVCGGYRYDRAERVRQILDAAVERLGLTEIVVTSAGGAAKLAREWAAGKPGVTIAEYRFDRKAHGKTAEPITHDLMLRERPPEVVIAFAGKWETWDIVQKAHKIGARVVRVDPGEWPR